MVRRRTFQRPRRGQQFAVEDDVLPAVGGDQLQGGVQVLCLGGEHCAAFVAVAVGGRPGDPEAGAQQCQVFLLAEPDEYE